MTLHAAGHMYDGWAAHQARVKEAAAQVKEAAREKAKEAKEARKRGCGSEPAQGRADKAAKVKKPAKKPAKVDNTLYRVERILDHRDGDAGELEYFVKWHRWGTEHNSWEPETHIADPSLVEEYMQSEHMSLTNTLIKQSYLGNTNSCDIPIVI